MPYLFFLLGARTDPGIRIGLLLLGPPGNGKTESIKVLLKESGQAALYVKSFTTQVGPEHGVRAIFNHARANAPCILVLEDLDSMVGPGVRSFFLNELDGLVSPPRPHRCSFKWE